MDLWLNETRVERAQLINDRKCQKLSLECNFFVQAVFSGQCPL